MASTNLHDRDFHAWMVQQTALPICAEQLLNEEYWPE